MNEKNDCIELVNMELQVFITYFYKYWTIKTIIKTLL